MNQRQSRARAPVSLVQLSAAPAGAPAPARVAPQATRPALPRPLTTFIGRETEMAAILAILARDDVRLLTLTGPGGIGKTRLAIRIAEMAPGFPDGVWFVPLAAITDPELALPAIAGSIGVSRLASHPPEEALTVRLAAARALLVLDNFEQVVRAGPFVCSLLSACPHLKALVTSRTLLHLSGEHVYAVPPLVIPEPDAAARSGASEHGEAIRLFVERARTRRPDFELTESNVTQVAAICRQLDGLPLGIELAAARLSVLSPADLLRRLDARLVTLVDGARDQPGRLRSLRESIAWSYDLLPPHERDLFRRLGVFAGAWTLEAAEAVAYAPDEPQPVPVIDGVAGLIDKNLVRHQIGPDGESQYQLLETIREFATEQLAASEVVDAMRERLIAYLQRIACESTFAQFMPNGSERFERCEMHAADVWRALGILDRKGDADGLIGLAGPVSIALYNLGSLYAERRWMERAIALGRSTGSPLLGRALIQLGIIVHLQGEEPLAWKLLQEGLERVTAHGDAPYQFHALTICGLICQRNDAVAEAREYQLRALAMIRTLPGIPWRPFAESTVLSHLGNNAIARGDIPAATRYFDASIAIQTRLGDEPGTSHFTASHPIAGRGDVARAEHDQVAALAHYQRALRLSHDSLDYRATVYALGSIAAARACSGQWLSAARLFGAAERLHERAGLHFALETMDRQRGLGLPEPWFRASDPFGSGQLIHDALWSAHQPPFPRVPDPERAESAWQDGRSMTLAEAVTAALATEPPIRAPESDLSGLTAREVEVIRLVSAGLSDGEIAESLYVSRRTVATHLGHIFDKIDVSSRAAAAAWAVRRGVA